MPDFGRPIFHAAGTLSLQKSAAAALKFPSSAYIYAIMGLLVSLAVDSYLLDSLSSTLFRQRN